MLTIFVGSEGIAQSELAQVNCPPSIEIVLHDLHESPSVITFSPTEVSNYALIKFAKELCRATEVRVEAVRPRLFQRLSGRSRSHIFC